MTIGAIYEKIHYSWHSIGTPEKCAPARDKAINMPNDMDGKHALDRLFFDFDQTYLDYYLQRQNAVGLMDRGVSDDDVGRDFWQRRRLGGPFPQS